MQSSTLGNRLSKYRRKKGLSRGVLSEEYCPIKSIAVRSIPIKRIGTGPDGSAELGALKLTWLFRISGTRCGMLSLLLTFDF
jgi:hypothetical protein